MDDEILLNNIRLFVAQGVSILEALDQLGIAGDQRVRLQTIAEAELGLEIQVGPGIAHERRTPWIDGRQITWFHWDRLRRLWARDHKMPAGAIRTIDRTTRALLDNMPPPDIEEFDWRGMVVGNVQSGKTANFTALISKAADAGYGLFIVLSGLLNALRLQTQLRLSREILGTSELGGEMMPPGRQWHALTNDRLDGDYARPGGMGGDLLQPGQTPTIAIVKKNVRVMDRLNSWLEDIQLERPGLMESLPVLIIDDESDEASIDTRRDGEPSSTNRELRRLLTIFRRRAYLGFTATPYANCFIPGENEHRDWGEDLYPRDYILPLETSDAYTGSERVFGREPVWDEEETPALPGLYREIPETERPLLVPPNRDARETFTPEMTPSLREAVLSYLLAGAARLARGEADRPCTMLVHIERYTRQHELQKQIIEGLLDEIYGIYAGGNGLAALERELARLWDDGFAPTIRALDATRELDFVVVRSNVLGFLEMAKEVRVINNASDDVVDFVREPSLKAIVVGGQNLGRGLTLEGLVTTFFLRVAGNQSTAMQMQRWCGYRGRYLDLMRVFTTSTIREFYREFLSIEREMRDELKKYERERLSPLEVGMRLRQHPDVPLVSAAKRGAQRPLTGKYSGKLPQTTVFPMEDEDLFTANLEATGRLVDHTGARGAPILERGRWIWHDVDVAHVIEFLRDYEYRSMRGRTSFHSAHIRRYIEEKNTSDGHLVDWTVVVCGRQNEGAEGTVDLGLPGPVNRRRRGRASQGDNPNRIGIITDPEDERIWLDTDSRGIEARAQRSPENGLLLLYPIKHPDRETTIIGVAFSFSTQLVDRGHHVAGSAPTEDELAEE